MKKILVFILALIFSFNMIGGVMTLNAANDLGEDEFDFNPGEIFLTLNEEYLGFSIAELVPELLSFGTTEIRKEGDLWQRPIFGVHDVSRKGVTYSIMLDIDTKESTKNAIIIINQNPCVFEALPRYLYPLNVEIPDEIEGKDFVSGQVSVIIKEPYWNLSFDEMVPELDYIEVMDTYKNFYEQFKDDPNVADKEAFEDIRKMIGKSYLVTLAGDTKESVLGAVALLEQNPYVEYAALVYLMPLHILMGDLNGDGLVNVLDLNMLYQYVRGIITLTPQQLVLADLNKDGAVDIIDVNILNQVVRGIIPQIYG